MKRRTLLGVSFAAALPLPAWALSDADQGDVARVAGYLNAIHTLKARFQQVAPDGGTSGGTAWLERPGRMRFAYDPPSPLLLVANKGIVIFHDSQLDQTSNIPLANTPLGILLAPQVELSGAVTTLAVDRLPGELQLTMTRTASPGDGRLTLILADRPLALRGWMVIDGQGNQTRVSLTGVDLGGTFDQTLFDYVAARQGD